jgi:hypothetical protein
VILLPQPTDPILNNDETTPFPAQMDPEVLDQSTSDPAVSTLSEAEVSPIPLPNMHLGSDTTPISSEVALRYAEKVASLSMMLQAREDVGFVSPWTPSLPPYLLETRSNGRRARCNA